ncbi:hypothetical protein FRC10_004048, partial [Ceratobasidium sp. 414]
MSCPHRPLGRRFGRRRADGLGWGVPSIRDEDFEGTEESFSPEDAQRKEKPLMDGDRESQYALDARPTEHTFGPFKLSPSLFGTTASR